MSCPIRILHVLNGLGTGGAEAIVMNWYRHINRTKVQFDFLVRSKDNVYADEIADYGGRVFVMPSYPVHYFSNRRETTRFFKEHASDYVGIHVHGNALLYVNVFNIARKYGIDLRIYHSHSVATNVKYFPFHVLNRCRIKRLATDYFACSNAAGEWAFKNMPYTVIKNGIISENFKYSENVRNSVRDLLGISDKTVYGHVGRFVPVKNHGFLLDVFQKIIQKDDNSVLLLLGEGELFDSIKKIVNEKGISDKVFFLGRRQNLSDYMNAMDVFLLPSFHEGLPIVAVEAQAAGLPTVLSDSITREVSLTDLVQFLPITDSSVWADQVLRIKNMPRKNTQKEIIMTGYDISNSVQFLENFYCSRF